MLSKTGFTHSDLLRWQSEYAGRSLNVNGSIMRDTYTTNHFRTCRLMVTGRVKNIGTATFTKDPLVTIAIPGSDEGMKFIFENTSSNWNEVAALEIDDILTISGMDTRKGQFGGLFLSNAEIMNTLHSRNSREMMVERNGFYDRILCEKRAIQADISDYN
ncbi:hypothetical protein [Klebsiella grimontii]|uniref:hypothetical protein n=1 Tax=Klebsiella grimontii TaxID=2058152 RepID=UPI00211441CE